MKDQSYFAIAPQEIPKFIPVVECTYEKGFVTCLDVCLLDVAMSAMMRRPLRHSVQIAFC